MPAAFLVLSNGLGGLQTIVDTFPRSSAMKRLMRGVVTTSAFVLMCAWHGVAHAPPVRFAALGDMPYGSPERSYPPYRALIEHFGRYDGAVVYTPGDNEWTDSHRPNNGAYDPPERLTALRQRFYTPGRPLGRRRLIRHRTRGRQQQQIRNP